MQMPDRILRMRKEWEFSEFACCPQTNRLIIEAKLADQDEHYLYCRVTPYGEEWFECGEDMFVQLLDHSRTLSISRADISKYQEIVDYIHYEMIGK